MIAIPCAGQLCGHTQLFAGRADTTLDDVLDTQIGADAPNVVGLALVAECRCSSDDFETLDGRESVDQLLADAVAKVLLILSWAHVCKWQHGYRPDGHGRMGL